MKKGIIIIGMVAGLFAVQCSRFDNQSSLKESVEDGAAKINSAVAAIAQTKGFELISVSDDGTKSADSYSDSITLDLIAGIYDFQPRSFVCSRHYRPLWVFEKIGESDSMIVHMPYMMAFHPRHLHEVNIPDTIAENNFTIAASEYHFYYSLYEDFGYDYLLSAGLILDTIDLGRIDVSATGTSPADNSYTSVYSFTDEYSIGVGHERGDTSLTWFALMENDDTLLKESVEFIRSDYRWCERTYVLSVGDVDIVKASGVDSIQVYLDGVLQQNAAEIVSDESDDDSSICHRRDIQITFDDGTTVLLSELLEPALTTLRSLVSTMHTMSFARKVIDYLALTIYYQTYYYGH